MLWIPTYHRISMLETLATSRATRDKSISLLDLLRETHGLEATNPVDGVFALASIYHDIHGITPGKEEQGTINMDCNSPVQDIYRTIAEHIISTSKSLDLPPVLLDWTVQGIMWMGS